MLYSFWEFAHNIGTHFYTLPFLVLGIAAAATALVHHRNQKKRDEEFEKKSEQNAKKTA